MNRCLSIAAPLALVLSTHARTALALPPILPPPEPRAWWSFLFNKTFAWLFAAALWGAIGGVRLARSEQSRGRLRTVSVALARLILRAGRTKRAGLIWAIVAIFVTVAMAAAVVSSGQEPAVPETPLTTRAYPADLLDG